MRQKLGPVIGLLELARLCLAVYMVALLAAGAILWLMP
jgi:hypothetical protein